MQHVTVLIDLRGVLGGLVVTLLKDAYGAAAVSEVPLGEPLADAITRARPRVVITSLDGGADPAVVPPPALTQLLDAHPHLKILVVEGDGRSGSMWELRPHRVSLGELSPKRLIHAVGEHTLINDDS